MRTYIYRYLIRIHGGNHRQRSGEQANGKLISQFIRGWLGGWTAAGRRAIIVFSMIYPSRLEKQERLPASCRPPPRLLLQQILQIIAEHLGSFPASWLLAAITCAAAGRLCSGATCPHCTLQPLPIARILEHADPQRSSCEIAPTTLL